MKTKKINKGYILINTITGSHAHLKSRYGCHCVKKFIQNNVTPDDEYLRESVRRMLKGMNDKKVQRYYNVSVKSYKYTITN